MLTFFRKIRKSFIDSSSARKYVLYAIGEIALVVIGILIALQINNWNEWRKDRILERELLVEIQNTLERNNEIMKQRLDRMQQYNQSSDIVLNLFQDKPMYHDSINRHFQMARWSGKGNLMSMSYAGYEALKDAGLTILSSKELRKIIIEFFENQMPYLEKRIDQSKFESHSHDHFYISNFYESINDFRPFDPHKILSDQYAFSLFSSLKTQRLVLIIYVSETLVESERVLQLVKEELGEE
jgi:hypothetical protein